MDSSSTYPDQKGILIQNLARQEKCRSIRSHMVTTRIQASPKSCVKSAVQSVGFSLREGESWLAEVMNGELTRAVKSALGTELKPPGTKCRAKKDQP